MSATRNDKGRQDLDTSPWWRQRYCWLVISGPLVVVIAALSTVVLAYHIADPVVPEYLSAQLARSMGKLPPTSLQSAQDASNAEPVRVGAMKPLN
jgi:hypothetical protein